MSFDPLNRTIVEGLTLFGASDMPGNARSLCLSVEGGVMDEKVKSLISSISYEFEFHHGDTYNAFVASTGYCNTWLKRDAKFRYNEATRYVNLKNDSEIMILNQ
ncbi:unnamed protein product [Lasius platythorax]|uniref:Uncharacterized protein n=1 Tax=Lasius platythorax TaxID=488582 RepID=A0AAV2NKN8_9HYME